MAEQWADVPDTEGLYQVSTLGRVRSLRAHNGLTLRAEPRLLSPGTNERGYQQFKYRIRGHTYRWGLHRLVLTVFVGPPADPRMEGDHIDRNPSNNRLSNLRWVTRSENCKCRVMPPGSSQARLAEHEVREIREQLHRGASQRPLARQYGVAQGQISNIKRGKTWSWLT